MMYLDKKQLFVFVLIQQRYYTENMPATFNWVVQEEEEAHFQQQSMGGHVSCLLQQLQKMACAGITIKCYNYVLDNMCKTVSVCKDELHVA